jgi:prepilin-type N-terminal cleavage/methylation domain-containing protein
MRFKGSYKAFTLVELLVVIAIISVLVGLISIAVILAGGVTKNTKAKSEISNMSLAITAYSQDWGYPPPDVMARADGTFYYVGGEVPYPAGYGNANTDVHPSSPNECLVFYLATEFRPDCNYGDMFRAPYPLLDPGTARPVSYATKTCGPYLDIAKGSLRPVTGRTFASYMDPWGLPYYYNARGGAYGDPQHKPDFDLFSAGRNQMTAQLNINVGKEFVTSGFKWIVTLGDPRSGNDVDTANGGNPLGGNYGLKDQDDCNNWQ